MSVMMDAFTSVMVKATGAFAEGLVEAAGGREAKEEVKEKLEAGLPQVSEKMKSLISETRIEIYDQIEKQKAKMQPLLGDSAFDAGPNIIERYDFDLPRLTEQLDDTSLARYTMLLAGDDPQFSKMFQELTCWMSSLPLQKR